MREDWNEERSQQRRNDIQIIKMGEDKRLFKVSNKEAWGPFWTLRKEP